MSEPKTKLEMLVSTAQVFSVVAGVVVSVLSFNVTLQKEAEVRRIEAEKPFQELRRAVYLETVKTAAVIATAADRPASEVAKAKRRFWELYIAELAMVDESDVAERMVALAKAGDPDLVQLSPQQLAALQLSRALGSSYTTAGRLPH